MLINKISGEIIDCAFQVHINLGPGLFESVYQAALCYELKQKNFNIEIQKPIPLQYKNINFNKGFYADIIVENLIILELKSVDQITTIHKKQLLTYLKLSKKNLGLLINFGSELIKDGIYRVVSHL